MMPFACWTTKATNTHSKYVIFCFCNATMVAQTRLNVTLYVVLLAPPSVNVLFLPKEGKLQRMRSTDVNNHGSTAPSGPGPPHCRGFTTTPKTHGTRHCSPGRVIGPTQRLLSHNTHKRQTSMPSVGFEPTISARGRP